MIHLNRQASEANDGFQATADSSEIEGGVIWVTGYSAAGKTTVGRKLASKLRADGYQTVFLDGDELRSIFSGRWGYEREERIQLAMTYFRLCSHLSSQGVIVVIAAVAMYDEIRRWLHDHVPNAIEAYLQVPNAERRHRDSKSKGIYKDNENLEAVYDPVRNPDIEVANFGTTTADEAADRIRAYFYENGIGHDPDRCRKRHWDHYYRSDAAPLYPTQFATEVAQSLHTPMRLMDVGTGNGRDAAFFSSLGHTVTAIDASRAAIDLCSQRYAERRIEFLCSKAEDLASERADSFDAIYTRFCLHAMTPQEERAFIAAAFDLLHSGGCLFIECRSINDPLSRKGEVISPTERVFGHYRRFIIYDELLEVLQAKGFHIVKGIESNGLAKLGEDDPIVIRITARKNNVN